MWKKDAALHCVVRVHASTIIRHSQKVVVGLQIKIDLLVTSIPTQFTISPAVETETVDLKNIIKIRIRYHQTIVDLKLVPHIRKV